MSKPVSSQDQSRKSSPLPAGKSINFRHYTSLGASGHGAVHWKMQRLSALALIPLVVWLMITIISNFLGGYEPFRASLHHPSVVIGLMLFFAFAYYHAYLGLETVYKDYIHHSTLRGFVMVLTLTILGGLGLLSIFALARLYFA